MYPFLTNDEIRALIRFRSSILPGRLSAEEFTTSECKRLRFMAYLYQCGKLDDGPRTSWGDATDELFTRMGGPAASQEDAL